MRFYLLHNGQPSARRLLNRVSRLTSYRAANAIEAGDYIIRFGRFNESDPDVGNLMNPQIAIARTLSRKAMARFLRQVGIRFPLPDNPGIGGVTQFTRQYRIPVFNLQSLSCYRSDGGSARIPNRIQRIQESFTEVNFSDDIVARRASFLAIRALVALGLDFGLVSIGMGPKGALHIIDIVPAPVLDGVLLNQYAHAIEKWITEQEQLLSTGVQGLLLGTDLEVMLKNQEGKMVLASNYFTRKGRVGCDDRSVNFDGQRLPLMELRPAPASTPAELTENLQSTMLEAIRVINRARVEWRAGSMPFRPYCTGGHIHFSGVPISSRFIKVLDLYLGLPLMHVEYRATASRRRPKYGFLGDIRPKDYGGFEYRTPASFVVSPVVTKAAFSLAYLCALYQQDLPVFDLYEPVLQLAFYHGDLDRISVIVRRTLEAMRRVPLYEAHREVIDPLYEMIETNETWNENVDVRTAWNLPVAMIQKTSVRLTKTKRNKRANA